MFAEPRIIGHRGAAMWAPENTLAGFREAHRLGARWVEFDVQASRDHHPFLLHDRRLDRTTDGHGVAALRSAVALAQHDAGRWFGPRFRGEHVPLLADAMALFATLGLGAVVEVKAAAGRGAATMRAVLKVVAHWPASLPPPILSSFDEAALETALAEAPHLPRALIVKSVPRDWRHRTQRLQCAALHAAARALDRATVAAVTRHLPLRAYTVNASEEAKTLFQQGIAAVFTDCPDVLISAFGHQAAQPAAVGGAGESKK